MKNFMFLNVFSTEKVFFLFIYIYKKNINKCQTKRTLEFIPANNCGIGIRL